MAIEAIVSDKAPAALGPYSAGTRAGNVIHVSGQLGILPETGEFAGEDVAAQTRQSRLRGDERGLRRVLRGSLSGPRRL